MSLRTRILLLVLAASLLPMLTVGWIVFKYRAETLALVQADLGHRARTVADELEGRVAATGQLLFGLGRVPLLEESDPARCSAFLADVLRERPQYTGLLTIRPDGKLHCDSLRTGRKLDLRDRDYFRRALTSKGPVTELVIGRLTGKGVLQVAYPVREAEGSLKYILLASLDMDIFGQDIARTLPYGAMHLQVWNHDASVILDYGNDPAGRLAVDEGARRLMLSPAEGATRLLAQDGARLWAKALLSRYADSGVGVALVAPEASLSARAVRQSRESAFILILLGIAFFAVAIAFAEVAVRRQTARLMAAISRLDGGDYRPQIGAPYPRGEIGQVMQALDRLADSLAQQRLEIARNTEALEHQARVDALTQLANRHQLAERLAQTLAQARRSTRIAAVMLLDLDRFKTINDSLGHSQGDRLLQAVAERLKGCVREDDTVARLGGDEFVVVLADMAEVDDIVPVARKILDALAVPVDIGAQALSVGSSLGIAVFPRDGDSAAALLQYADTAMYEAKAQGGNAMAFFSPEMKAAITARLEIEAGLRRALDQKELRVHYQPIVDAATGRVVAAEALVRWQHPREGLVSPLSFIPVAEETGLILPLGAWVMAEACHQARAWQDLRLGDIPVSVNLSARQFSVPHLEDTVLKALEDSGLPPRLLQLEITESSLLEQFAYAQAAVTSLVQRGVSFAIDDFGTGYASLSQLKRFPIAQLKIDRSFVQGIGSGSSDDVLVEAVLTLAARLGLKTVAEGVESAAQQKFLSWAGCERLQGFLFAAPLPPEDFIAFVRRCNSPFHGGAQDQPQAHGDAALEAPLSPLDGDPR
ncbi:MAG: EAL domain-containing protein [Azonexus sp.]|nr:EAL domain-containing protein [Betaproteobacteria bacterium]MBK8918062.1 EAL domain-containing protein [Betaproteobacteria bacterium]MBP6036807.1 EAL domain-containing protein [Azonexus sp.]MBP6907296.1 EAL domain-containing protein [Azonexus sp.]